MQKNRDRDRFEGIYAGMYVGIQVGKFVHMQVGIQVGIQVSMYIGMQESMQVDIWLKMIKMGNVHFPYHFLSVFMVPWSQNEHLEGQKKIIQLSSTLMRVMGWPFYMASGLNLKQLTINSLWKGQEIF